MAEHKKQHFVPRSYLKAWCDPATPDGQEPYVWLFSRDGSNPRRKAPDNIFHETNTYTIERPDGGRNLVLEHGLAQLEREFVSIRDTKLQRLEPLEEDEHILLCAFVGAMHARSPAQRAHLGEQWSKVLDKANLIREWAKTATPEQKRRASAFSQLTREERRKSLTYDQVKALAEKPLQNMLVPMIRAETRALCGLDIAVFTLPDDQLTFITSDCPCVWFDAEACKRPPMFQTPALMYESIEITMPISPRQVILFNRRGATGYFPGFEKLVDEFNRRTRFSCDQYFVNNGNETRAIWFDPGVEPEDSWRRRQAQEASGESPAHRDGGS